MAVKFKITAAVSKIAPFALYVQRRPDTWWFYGHWDLIDFFATREEARAHYEKVKDLPEYLGG